MHLGHRRRCVRRRPRKGEALAHNLRRNAIGRGTLTGRRLDDYGLYRQPCQSPRDPDGSTEDWAWPSASLALPRWGSASGSTRCTAGAPHPPPVRSSETKASAARSRLLHQSTSSRKTLRQRRRMARSDDHADHRDPWPPNAAGVQYPISPITVDRLSPFLIYFFV